MGGLSVPKMGSGLNSLWKQQVYYRCRPTRARVIYRRVNIIGESIESNMDKLSFAIAPYLPTKETFTFAGYQFVPLRNLHAYAEGSILEAATVIAGMYRNQMNEPIRKATFIFPLNKILGEYLDETIVAQLSDILKALYLDAFCHMNQLDVVTAENFEVIFYDMHPNDYSLATRSGSVFPTTNLGGDMKKTVYTAPLHVIVDRGNLIPSELMSPALAHVAGSRTPSLLNALSFFLQSMRNDDRLIVAINCSEDYIDVDKEYENKDNYHRRKVPKKFL